VRAVGFALWFVALGLAAWVIVRSRLQERAALSISRPRPTAIRISPPLVRDDEEMWR
jgi:hypothetical protein